MSTLLEKMRRLNKILMTTGGTPLSFNELCDSLKDILLANVYVASKKGKAIGLGLYDHEDSPLIDEEGSNVQIFPHDYTEQINKINEVKVNLTRDSLIDVFKNDIDSYTKFATIIPIVGKNERQGTMILSRRTESFTEEDLVLAEYASAIIGLEILRSKSEAAEAKARKQALVEMAIGTLSYSEREAIEHIFNELEGDEGLLVASKVADRAGITRSVIVNALRKFESAGLIESRSLGMKGTYIKILNDMLKPELERIKR